MRVSSGPVIAEGTCPQLFTRVGSLGGTCGVPVSHLLNCRMQHIMIDLGTGNNNKINWAMNDKQVSNQDPLMALSSSLLPLATETCWSLR